MRKENFRIVASSAPPVAPPDTEASQFWRFENVADSGEATMYVYGDIVTYDMEDWNWPDDVVPNKFKNELNELGNVSRINVRINSNGGSVFGAYAIMNLLKNHKAEIIVHIDGIAASAATLIAMAGDKIITALGSVWMIHLPSFSIFFANLNANDLDKMKSSLSTITQSMTDIYHAKTGIAKDQLEQMMSDEKWMTGTEAQMLGFADEVTETEAVAYLNSDKQTAIFNGLTVDLSQVRNKDKLLGMLNPKPSIPAEKPPEASTGSAKPAKAQTAPTEAPQNTNEEESIMNLEELKAKHPDIYTAAVKDGEEKGVQAERARIKEIDAMALPGMEALTNKAKFESGVTAGEFAVELIKAQKQSGAKFLNDAAADAEESGTGAVPASPNALNNDAQEEQALLAHMGERAKNMR